MRQQRDLWSGTRSVYITKEVWAFGGRWLNHPVHHFGSSAIGQVSIFMSMACRPSWFCGILIACCCQCFLWCFPSLWCCSSVSSASVCGGQGHPRAALRCVFLLVSESRWSMDPDEATRNTLTTLDAVATWAGLSGPLTDDDSPRKQLFTLLGYVGTEAPRIVWQSSSQRTLSWHCSSGAFQMGPTQRELPPWPCSVKLGSLQGHAGSYATWSLHQLLRHHRLYHLLQDLWLQLHGRSRCRKSSTKLMKMRWRY